MEQFIKKIPFFEKHYGTPCMNETKTVLLNNQNGIIYVDADSMYYLDTSKKETLLPEEIKDDTFHYSWVLDRSETVSHICTFIPLTHSVTSITTIAYTISPDIRLQIEYFTCNPLYIIDFYFFLTTPNFIPWKNIYHFLKKMNIHVQLSQT